MSVADDAVEIAEYDPAWPLRFEEEKARILGAIGSLASAVEHVGSTAVPGLAAKPVVDVLVGIERREDLDRVAEPLRAIGYEYMPDTEAVFPERRFFRKRGPDGRRTHHVHVVARGSDFWETHLLFRDRLRANPREAAAYAALKRDLAARHRNDREAYTEAKSAFVREILERALRERRPG